MRLEIESEATKELLEEEEGDYLCERERVPRIKHFCPTR